MSRYGFFRDELYYIACGKHLAFGYTDQPPLVAVMARLGGAIFGPTLEGFRWFPAIAAAASVLLAGLLAREFGGGRFAQTLASLAVMLCPSYLAFGSFLSMNAFEPLLWMTCAYIVARILKGSDPRLWLVFGAVAGIGLQNKNTMLLFGFAIAAGLIFAGNWNCFRSKWFWMGGMLAFAIFLPNVMWQAQHQWPQVAVVRYGQTFKNTAVSPLRFLGEQALFFNPVATPLVVAGVAWLLFARRARRFRCFGWALPIVLAAVITLHGKTYYPLPVYGIVMAAGASVFEYPLFKRRKWVRTAYMTILVAAGVMIVPFCVPVLPLERMLRYQAFFPLEKTVRMEHDSTAELHQLYSDMLGWDTMVATIAEVYRALPPEEQSRCAILAGNYGEAGAIDVLGVRYGLPPAISGHNNYYLWGTHGHRGDIVILFGQHAEVTKKHFGVVQQVATIANPYAAPAEKELPIYVCRKPHAPLHDLWESLRYYE